MATQKRPQRRKVHAESPVVEDRLVLRLANLRVLLTQARTGAQLARSEALADGGPTVLTILLVLLPMYDVLGHMLSALVRAEELLAADEARHG
jgi:hypothetical protein